MAFKILEKGVYGLRGIGDDTVSFNLTAISVGEKFKDLFKDTTHAEIYTDEEKGLVAVKPSMNSSTAFPLRWENRRGQISVPIVRRANVVKGVYKSEVIDGMVISKNVKFSIPTEEKTTKKEFSFEN